MVAQRVTHGEGPIDAGLAFRREPQVAPAPAGLAFFREAQLALRHADQAARAAAQARLTGSVSVGLSPTTASVLGVPLMRAMHERYPDVRLHMVGSLSGHLSNMLNARQLDLAVLFDTQPARRWSVLPLLEERLFLIRSAQRGVRKPALRRKVALAQLGDEPLILPTGPHGLRSRLDTAFAQARVTPRLAMEIDSLALLMDAVDMGLGSTIQPWAAVGRYADAGERFVMAEISDAPAFRPAALCSLSDDELSPAALAARVVLGDCVRELVQSGRWIGAALISAV
jgi:LysR family tcuABC transcriptional regulator